MLIVLFIIFLLMIIGGALITNWADKKAHELTSTIGAGEVLIGMITIFFIMVCIIFCIVDISKLKVADSKIAMYEEENTRIEQDIATIVKDYMNYEKDTYKVASEQIDSSSLLVLTELYPDLKSNELVKKQIDVYTENSNKIKQLKEEKINNQICKWWLYFGEMEQTKEE